ERWMVPPPVPAVAVRAAPYERRAARSSGRLVTAAEPAVPARAGRHVPVPDGRNPVGREAGLERPPAGSPARPAPAPLTAGPEDGPEQPPARSPAPPAPALLTAGPVGGSEGAPAGSPAQPAPMLPGLVWLPTERAEHQPRRPTVGEWLVDDLRRRVGPAWPGHDCGRDTDEPGSADIGDVDAPDIGRIAGI